MSVSGWGSPDRLRRFVREFVVDRVSGRLGFRAVRAPGYGGRRRVIVVAETVDCLLDVSAQRGDASIQAHRFTIYVGWWVAPRAHWTARPRPQPGLMRQRARLPLLGRGPVRVDLIWNRPAPVAQAVAAALALLRPTTAMPTAGAHTALGAAARAARTLAPTRADQRESPAGEDARAPAGDAVAVIDGAHISPGGRRPESYRADAPALRLRVDGAGARLIPESTNGRVPWTWPGRPAWRELGTTLDWRAVAALRSVGVIECGQLSGVDAATEAGLVAQLAMTGVVLHATGIAGPVAERLAPELTAMLVQPLPVGSLDQEVRSVRQRRSALRHHSVQFGLNGHPTVSVVLTTKRTEYLPGILRAIAEQTYPYLEIILCLHGIGLPDECADYLDHCGRPHEVVPVAAGLTFGTALGLATRRASGVLLTKFDDDDTYGPEHVWDLVLARAYSGATLVGKGIEFVHLEEANVTVRRRSGQPEAYTDVVAGGTMLIGRDELEQLGGWQPVSHSVDQALLDRVNRAGATVYRTHPFGYLYHRRPSGHTWAADDAFFLRTAYRRWPGLPELPELGRRHESVLAQSAGVDEAEHPADHGDVPGGTVVAGGLHD